MRRVVIGMTYFVLMVGAGPSAFARKAAKYSYNSGYGPVVSGLRLAVRVDRAGKQVRFLVKNQGVRSVVINVRYSCSGYSHWWLRGGRSKGKLSRSYIWSARKQGLQRSTRVKPSICTVNGPIRIVTLKPGQVTAVTIPLAKGVKLKANRYLQGRVGLYLTVHKHVQLKTGITRRRTP